MSFLILFLFWFLRSGAGKHKENSSHYNFTIILCILVGLVLEYVYIESQPKDSDLDGWTDVEVGLEEDDYSQFTIVYSYPI